MDDDGNDAGDGWVMLVGWAVLLAVTVTAMSEAIRGVRASSSSLEHSITRQELMSSAARSRSRWLQQHMAEADEHSSTKQELVGTAANSSS